MSANADSQCCVDQLSMLAPSPVCSPSYPPSLFPLLMCHGSWTSYCGLLWAATAFMRRIGYWFMLKGVKRTREAVIEHALLLNPKKPFPLRCGNTPALKNSSPKPFPLRCMNGINFQKDSPQKIPKKPFPLRCENTPALVAAHTAAAARELNA
ncbi:hypothetical protein K438DRAFT_1764321 [Mycena galopus ATCC 62051]|nr:hypothetical protein K438DRAFT_1764321 [Mycena galopus ATCC 62051]